MNMNSSSTPAVEMPGDKPKKSAGKRRLGIKDIFLGLLPLGLLVFSLFVYFRDRSGMEAANAAYAEADCDATLNHLYTVRDAPRLFDSNNFERDAKSKLYGVEQDCKTYLEAVALQDAGKFGEALRAYADFASVKTAHPLVAPMHARADEGWQDAALDDIVVLPVCGGIDQIVSANFLKDAETNAPVLYAECALFYAADKQFMPALETYEKYLASYGSHSDRFTYYDRMNAALWDTDAAELAADNLCGAIERLDTLSLFVDKDENLPDLYWACGAHFAEQKDYDSAITFYEVFKLNYPEHPDIDAVTDEMAAVILTQASQTSGGTVEQPEAFRVDGTTNAILYIQNAAPQGLRITLSGPQTYVETLPPCDTCQTVTSAAQFAGCPDDGPYGEYTIAPGNYQVVVSATGYGVTPFNGNWQLSAGFGYSNCFFITTSSLPAGSTSDPFGLPLGNPYGLPTPDWMKYFQPTPRR